MGPEISVVIPVYRSASTLPTLHQRLTAALTALVDERYEIVYVDDVSPDNAWEVLQELKGDDVRTVLLRLMQNSGQQRAVICGVAHARGEHIVTMDDDLQQRPEEIEILYREFQATSADVVIGSYPRKKHGFARKLGTAVVRRLAQTTVGAPRDLEFTSFRIFSRAVGERLARQRNPSPVVGFLLLAVTRNIRNVPVSHDERHEGRSTYSVRRLIEYFSQMILDYSDLPLRLVGYLGFLVALGSFGLGIYYFSRALFGGFSVQGWATIVLLICFFSGLILMSLGVIGVYLMRVLRSVNVGQLYDVKEVIR